MNINSPLEIDGILEKIVSNLSLTDLKSARQVNFQWNAMSKTSFLKLSTFCFETTFDDRREHDPDPKKYNPKSRNILRFQEEFRALSLLPFRKVCFDGPFSESRLAGYFRDRNYIKELTLTTEFFVTDDRGRRLRQIDLSTWTGLNLTTLNVTGPAVRIPLNFLGAIKNLNLADATVVYNAKIAPTTIKMFDCVSECDGKALDSGDVIRFHKYFDAKNLKELRILWFRNCRSHFDLTEYLKLEILEIRSIDSEVELTGWHQNLTLKKLWADSYALDLVQLPPSVEELTFHQYGDHLVPPGRRFPSLRSLECSSDLLLLSKCPNLVRVAFHKQYLNLNLLPATVKVLDILTKCEFMGVATFQLEKIVFKSDDFPPVDRWGEMQNIIDRFKPQTVVLGQWVLAGTPGNELYYTRQMQFVQRQVDLGIILIMEACPVPFARRDERLNIIHTPDSHITDAGPTLWVNGIGKLIDMKEFHKLINSY